MAEKERENPWLITGRLTEKVSCRLEAYLRLESSQNVICMSLTEGRTLTRMTTSISSEEFEIKQES